MSAGRTEGPPGVFLRSGVEEFFKILERREHSMSLGRVFSERTPKSGERKKRMMERESLLRSAMETYGDTVYRLALCRTQSVPDAEDVYQDVFLKLLGQTAQAWEGEHLKAWLIRTTLNRCADLGRFRMRRQAVPLETAADLSGPDEEAEELWEAVGRLPEKLRITVHLYYAEGYRTEEIGELMGVPAATVRTRLHRARGKLRDLLGGADDGKKPLPEFE